MHWLARFVTRRPLVVLAVWIGVVLLALPFARLAPSRLTASPGEVATAESTRVARLLADRFGERDNSAVLLVGRSAYLVDDPRFRTRYDEFLGRLRDLPRVARVVPFDAQGVVRTVSADRKVTLTVVQIDANDDATLDRIRGLARAETGAVRYRVTGGQPIAQDFTRFAEQDTKRSEFTALPLTAIVLLLVFGALVATGLPLLVGVLSITVALAGVYFLTLTTDVSTFAQSVVTMLGLGAGIDYALLMVNRFREELASPDTRERVRAETGRTPTVRSLSAEAARRTVLTAGRSITFSGLTVAIAMGALLIPPLNFVRAMGFGGVLAVLLTVLASVTALPAMLTLLGPRVNSPRVLRFTWSQDSRASEAWTNFARRVISRPWLAVLASAGVLIVMALPATRMQLGYAGAYGLTPGVESRDALRSVEELGAGGLLSTFEVVVDLRGAPYDADARRRFRDAARALEGVAGVKAVVSPFVRVDSSAGGDLNDLVELTRRSISQDRRYLRLTVVPTRNLRAEEVDAFTGRIRAAMDPLKLTYLVGGAPVGGRDFTRALVDATPTAILVVLLGTFVLLAVAFRSLLIPLKSVLMNCLSVGAAYGVVTLVVQFGVGADLLGVPRDVGVLDSSLPLILFAVLFGLSMDYEIFLLSRVQEEHLRGAPNDEAIVRAVGRTGRIITSAAMIMFIVFAAFISGRVVANKSVGLGLAVAVLLDATLVRMILVPGFLKLAGRWNWWLPRWLDRRMPHVKVEH